MRRSWEEGVWRHVAVALALFPLCTLAAPPTTNSELADRATQEAQSATRLPPENDLANVFSAPDPDSPSVPACAHWDSRYWVSHGRIAGTRGDRIYIHPANPQVCDAALEPSCKAKAYLIPGDHVDVGFICGAWTYISYTPQDGVKGPTVGWVETARLYAVDAFFTGGPKEPANQPISFSNDPLISAVEVGDVARVKELVARGADPSGPGPGMQALKTAVQNGDTTMVQALLALGAEPNGRDPYRCSSIIRAVEEASQEVFEALVKGGMDVRCDDFGLQNLALKSRAPDVMFPSWRYFSRFRNLSAFIERLIAAGVWVDTPEGGETALMSAVKANNVDIARTLLKAGANPNAVNTVVETEEQVDGATPLITAINMYSRFRDPTALRILLNAGADPNYLSTGEYAINRNLTHASHPNAGITALHVAAEQGAVVPTKLLLEHGADPSLARSDGAVAVSIAQENQHPDVATLIESYLNRPRH